jgi:hypothetical protein
LAAGRGDHGPYASGSGNEHLLGLFCDLELHLPP